MRTNVRTGGLPRYCEARRRSVAYLFLAPFLALALTLSPARTQGQERSGKDVVDTICAKCHAAGANGAPRIGDWEAWRQRASQGLSALTLHALEGIRKMPGHGGHPELSDLEIARAVTYMVNRSGGDWVEPTSAEELAVESSGEQVVRTQCVKCHEEGVGGAPKIGDLEAWKQRISKGLAYLVRSAVHGHGGMPPRGGQADLTDPEIRSAILYMYNPTGMPAKPASGAASPTPAASADSHHKSVGGIEIFLGFMLAQDLRRFPEGSPERTMHGGVPTSSGYYHVNVSLLDEDGRAPINDAQVEMRLVQPGLTSAATELEPMMIGMGSYGNYVKLEPRSRYLITLRITRPGTTWPVEAKFQHRIE